MILYHITKKKWLESIMTYGLKPAYRKGILLKGRCKNVFLTNNINKILVEHCGIQYIKKHEFVVLHIDCTNIKLEPTRYRNGATYTISDFEFETNKIHPSKIIKIEPLHINLEKIFNNFF